VRTIVRIVLLSLASIALVVAATQAFPGRKPCARLCASAIAACIGSCRRAVADCRQSACASLSGRPARACRRRCRRPCKRECRAPILAACRLDGDRTRCDPPPSTTSTTTTTTTSTTLADKTDWATYGFDLERTSHNPREVTLGADNVGRLGQIWSTDVGAVVAASPVLASDVSVDGTTLDLLYIATEQGDLYALDAAAGRVVWQRNLGSQLTACADMPDGVFGITDTPFVDRTTRSLFVVGGDGSLYALDLATGTTRAGWPVEITSDPAHEHVWSAITLAGGALYVETASYCDRIPYYGRVVKIDLPTPSVVATWYVTSSPGEGPGGGGIWGWGGASVDSSGDLYVATGNATTTPENYGYAEGVVRLSSALEVQASHYPGLDGYDLDFGSTPVSYQAPGCPGQIVVENKSGGVFVYERDAIASGPTQRVEIGNGQLIGVPAYDPTTRMVYVSNSTDLAGGEYRHGLVAFSVGADCQLHLAWQQPQGVNGLVGSSPTVANGVVYYGDGPGNELFALSGDSGAVLWQSGSTIEGAIYAPPIVVNGRLYAAAWDHLVRAYAVAGAR
jgi:outer membrane protein assembly factor BamB